MKKIRKTMSIVSAAAILASIAAMPVSAAGINAYSVSYETLTSAITTDDGSTVPAGAVAVTMSIDNNAGFDSNTMTLDFIDSCNVFTNDAGKPIVQKGKVLEGAMMGTAIGDEENRICISAAMSDLCESNGSLFTVYIATNNTCDIVEKWTAEGKAVSDAELNAFLNTGSSTFSRPGPGGFQYRAGDCNNNNEVDAKDAALILQAMEQTNGEDLIVSELWTDYLYLTYFPSILVPEQADADGNTYINDYDSTVILDFSAAEGAGTEYTGSGCLIVGEWFTAVYPSN